MGPVDPPSQGIDRTGSSLAARRSISDKEQAELPDAHYVSDRDFFTDNEVADRESRATAERHKIVHLTRRNRECYLVEPIVLARLLESKWRAKRPGEEIPGLATKAGIRDLVLSDAKAREEVVRAALVVAHEAILKGDSSHRAREMIPLMEYFRANYTDVLARGEIPYRLLDGKEALSTIRRSVTAELGFSFSDRDVLAAYRRDEVPADLRALIVSVLNMFPAPPPGPPTQLPLASG